MKKVNSILFFIKRIKSIFYSFILIATLLQSCRKDADVILPNVEPKIVISSFISPQDSLIQVAVSLSNPLSKTPNASNKYKPLIDATVTISNGANSYTLSYNSNLERYVIDSSQLKIVGGLTYYLSVKSADGKYVSATTSIPRLNNTLTYTVTKNNLSNNAYILRGTWSDNDVTTIDNYRFEVFYTSFQLFSGYIDTLGSFTDTIKTWASDNIIISDKEGSVFQKELKFSYRTNKSDTVFTSITTMSKEYLDYTNKLNLALNSFSGPFSEPVQMYTNIDGGLGIFAGYNLYKQRVYP